MSGSVEIHITARRVLQKLHLGTPTLEMEMGLFFELDQHWEQHLFAGGA